MKKLNLLQSLALAGVAGITGSMFLAPSANAADIIFPDQTCFEGTASVWLSTGSIGCEDKVFDNFTYNIIEDPNQLDTIEVGIGAGEFFLDYRPIDDGVTSPPAARTGTIGYDITILPAFVDDGVTFKSIEIDSDVIGLGEYIITKDYETNNGISGQLESINGSSESGSINGATSVAIVDTLTPNGDQLFTIDNGVTQVETTPEPGSMLGILAVGGLALATRRKQAQK